MSASLKAALATLAISISVGLVIASMLVAASPPPRPRDIYPALGMRSAMFISLQLTVVLGTIGGLVAAHAVKKDDGSRSLLAWVAYGALRGALLGGGAPLLLTITDLDWPILLLILVGGVVPGAVVGGLAGAVCRWIIAPPNKQMRTRLAQAAEPRR